MNLGLNAAPRIFVFCRGLVAMLALAQAIDTAMAADWSLKTGLSETIDYDTNINLDVDPPGYAMGSISSLKADLIAKTPRSQLEFLSNLSYQNYWGPGATSDLDAFLPLFDFNFDTHTRNLDLNLGASYTVTSLTSADIDESGLIQETGVNQHTFLVDGGFTYRLNHLDTFALRSAASKVDFTPATDNVVPYEDLDNTFTYTRELSPTMDTNIVLGLEFYNADDEQNTKNTIYSAEGRLNSQLTRRFGLRLGAGLNAVSSDQKNTQPPDPSAGQTSNFSIGPIFSLGLDYRLKRGSFSLDLREYFSPTDFGDVDEIRQASIKYEYRFNDATTFALNAVYSHQIPAGQKDAELEADPTTAFSVNPRITYELARDWEIMGSYRFLTEKISEGSPTSHDFSLTLSRDLVLLP